MPARVNKLRHDENTRAKIKVALIIQRLQAFALGENDPSTKKPVHMDANQVKVSLGLLRKVLPDLSSVDHTGDLSVRHITEMSDQELMGVIAEAGRRGSRVVEAASGTEDANSIH